MSSKEDLNASRALVVKMHKMYQRLISYIELITYEGDSLALADS